MPVHRGEEACVLKISQLTEAVAATLPDRNDRAGGPVPKAYLDAAAALARELSARAGDRLVHADLHYGNVPPADREPWLAFDPRAVAGDPEHAVPEMLWARLDEVGAARLRRLLAILVTDGGLDPQLARSWSIVRCADYWLWALEHGLTDDPARCQRILEILIGRPA
jgi:streptomycin 6-kinase